MNNENRPALLHVEHQFPDLKALSVFDIDKLTAADVYRVITVALAGTVGADGIAKLRAQAIMEEHYARGRRDGYEAGRRDGYQAGYLEGLADGRMEVMEVHAAEQAEAATLKAAARSQLNSPNKKKG